MNVLFHILFSMFTLLVMGVSQLWAAPEIVFSPTVVNFGSVNVGKQDSLVLTIKNVGDAPLVISGGKLAQAGRSAFATTISAVQINAGDSIATTVVFRPMGGGTHADALTLQTNLSTDVLAPRPVVQVVGVGVGAEIDVAPTVLSFASQGIGAAAVQNLFVTNRGNDTLRVANIFTNDAHFSVDATTFNLGPGVERIVRVTYVPDNTLSRSDTLHIVSNDFDEDTLQVVLTAQETPQQVGAARLSLVRTGAPFPLVGDTVSVSVTLTPNSVSVAGVELFFGYDPTLFAPADSSAPFSKVGYSASRLQILTNAVVSSANNLAVAHLSGLGAASDSITTEGILTELKLVVKAPLTKNTRLRVLVEAPLFNTQFITPSGLAFTMPSANSMGLGNTPPVLRPFPPLNMSEDEPETLALLSLASDAESSPNELAWSFYDPDSLIVVSVSTPDSALGQIARFFSPPNASGTFAVVATVTDPAGAADSSVLVVDVAPINDPPSTPEVSSPGDNATEVAAPVVLNWSANDVDRDDALSYTVRFGQNRLFLNVLAENLDTPSHTLEASLATNAIYFWQVVARDASGAETSGPVWQFTTAPDVVAPVFVGGPEVSEVSDSTAVVFWSLDETASARIVMGFEADLADSSDVPAIDIAGSFQLRSELITGLIPGTQYYLQIALTDAVGNLRKSDILTLTTTGEKPLTSIFQDLGDFTGDRLVDFSDFIIFAAVFNKSVNDVEYIPNADFDTNAVINFSDFIVFAGAFGNNYAAPKLAE